MVYALALGASSRKGLRVQVPPCPPKTNISSCACASPFGLRNTHTREYLFLVYKKRRKQENSFSIACAGWWPIVVRGLRSEALPHILLVMHRHVPDRVGAVVLDLNTEGVSDGLSDENSSSHDFEVAEAKVAEFLQNRVVRHASILIESWIDDDEMAPFLVVVNHDERRLGPLHVASVAGPRTNTFEVFV